MRKSKKKRGSKKGDTKTLKARGKGKASGRSSGRGNFYRREGTISAPSLALCLDLVSRIFYRHIVMGDGVPVTVKRDKEWENKFNVTRFLPKKYRTVKVLVPPSLGCAIGHGHVMFAVKRLKIRCGNVAPHNEDVEDIDDNSGGDRDIDSRYGGHGAKAHKSKKRDSKSLAKSSKYLEESRKSKSKKVKKRRRKCSKSKSGSTKYLPPTMEHVYDFMKLIFTKLHLNTESSIVSLIYAERLMEKRRLCLTGKNWRCILVACVLTASKVWDDVSSWNIEFSNLLPLLSLSAINRLEGVFLHGIEYDLYISSSEYAKYYFAIRGLKRVGITAIPRYYLVLNLAPSKSQRMAYTPTSENMAMRSAATAAAFKGIGASVSPIRVPSRARLRPKKEKAKTTKAKASGRPLTRRIQDSMGGVSPRGTGLLADSSALDTAPSEHSSFYSSESKSPVKIRGERHSGSFTPRTDSSTLVVGDSEQFDELEYRQLSGSPETAAEVGGDEAFHSLIPAAVSPKDESNGLPADYITTAPPLPERMPASSSSSRRRHRRRGSKSDKRGGGSRRKKEEVGRGGLFSKMKRDSTDVVEIDKTRDVQIRRPITPRGPKLALGGLSLPFDYSIPSARVKATSDETATKVAVVKKRKK